MNQPRLMRLAAIAILLCSWQSVMAEQQANALVITAGHSQVTFDTGTAQPVRWVLCQTVCESGDVRRSVVFDRNDGGLVVAEERRSFEVDIDKGDDWVVARFVRQREIYEYRISATTPAVEISVPAANGLTFFSGNSFVPEQLPGIGRIYSRVQLAQVSADGQTILGWEEDEPVVHELGAEVDNWTGIRSRYWAFLVQPLQGSANVTARYSAENRPLLLVNAPDDMATLDLRLYAGPIEWKRLTSVAPELSEMLFAALWNFLRWLTFGMMILYGWLLALVGNHGLAIVLLSLSAKILMSPLTMLADRWQRDVNRIQSLLQPELEEIKRNYKGEEAHERTLAVYKKHDVSMFYTFKSAAGFLIQIPVFIAAFDMLAENIALNEVAFLWISDLAKPDQFAELPFVVPFFGGWLNLLPFLMTGLSTLAAWLQAEETLTPELQRQQSLRLYGMAAAFFVLFYTFPAGMVLYWTSSNLFHLIKVESGRLFNRG